MTTTTQQPTRADIEATIVELRDKAKRMPAHWERRRQDVADEIDLLVDDWLAAAG